MTGPIGSLLRRIRDDRRGTSVTEFGFVLIPMTLTLTLGIDMAYEAYVRAVVSGALEKATRSTTVQNANSTAIETALTDNIHAVMPGATVTIAKGTFYKYSQMDTMERLTTDHNSNGVLDINDEWEDVDDNSIRNVVTAGKAGIGAADDIVRYNVTVTYPRLMPVYTLIGASANASINSSTLVKRQPYATQAAPTIRRRLI